MFTKERIGLIVLLTPVICVLWIGAMLGLVYVRNQVRWRDDITHIRKPGDYEVSLNHDNRRRTYRLHLPPAYDDSTELPLVIALHGSTSNADTFARNTAFAEKADAEGFIVVIPNGSGRLPNLILTWNVGKCCGYSTRIHSDDVGFLRALIESLSANLAVDPDRVYVTGSSNGAMMSFAAACELSDLIAGVGSVSGALIWSPCEPEQPVSVLMINGGQDDLVPIEGGWLDNPGPIDDSVDGAIRFWTDHDSCGDALTSQRDNLVIEDYENCAAGSAVKRITVTDGGHRWFGGHSSLPFGGDPPADSFSATDAVWEFFAAR